MSKTDAAPQMTSQMHHFPLSSTVAVTDKPTMKQLQVWWQAMQGDDLSVAYADSFPQTLTDFCLEVAQEKKLLLLCLVDNEVAGALWLHDLHCNHQGKVTGGWIGCYFLPSYRGRHALQVWDRAKKYWEALGVKHFFTAINVDNKPSQAMITRGAHFHLVERFPRFTLFHGQPTDVFIYALHAEDNQLARDLAIARAARQIAGVM